MLISEILSLLHREQGSQRNIYFVFLFSVNIGNKLDMGKRHFPSAVSPPLHQSILTQMVTWHFPNKLQYM